MMINHDYTSEIQIGLSKYKSTVLQKCHEVHVSIDAFEERQLYRQPILMRQKISIACLLLPNRTAIHLSATLFNHCLVHHLLLLLLLLW